MAAHRYILVTGATSGIGLEAASFLARADAAIIVIAGVRQSANASALRQAVPPEQLIILPLDTSSLASVRSFAAEAKDALGSNSLSGVALNAGVQIVSGDRFSVDGYELTFATNVLGHIVLFEELEAAISRTAVVLSTASGTHDKDHKLAKQHKFFGGFFPSAADVAMGQVSASSDPAQVGRDRYATSKLCNVLFTYAMARRYGEGGPRFIAFDPGLMPGTELARDHPAAMRFAWKNILPTAAKLMDGASTAKRSGAVMVDLLLAKRMPQGTGLHMEFTGDAIPSSTLSHDEAVQDQLIEWVHGAAA